MSEIFEQSVYKNEVSGTEYKNEVKEGLNKENLSKESLNKEDLNKEDLSIKEFIESWEEVQPEIGKQYLEDANEANREEIRKYLVPIKRLIKDTINENPINEAQFKKSDDIVYLYEWELEYYLEKLRNIKRIYEGFNGRQIYIKLNRGNQWICLSGIKANIENGGYKYAPKMMIEFKDDVPWELHGKYLEELEDVEIEHTVFNYVGVKIIRNIFDMLIHSAVVANFEKEENKGYIESVEEETGLSKEEIIVWTERNLWKEEIVIRSQDLMDFLEDVLKKNREKEEENG